MKKKVTFSHTNKGQSNFPNIQTSNLNLSINNTFVLIRNSTQENLSFSKNNNLPFIFNNNIKKRKNLFSPIKLAQNNKIKNEPNIHTFVFKEKHILKSEYESNPLLELMTSNKILGKLLYFFNMRELLAIMNINKKVNTFIKNTKIFRKYINIIIDLRKGNLFEDINNDKISRNNKYNNNKNILKYNLLSKNKIKLTKIINSKVFNLKDSSLSLKLFDKDNKISDLKFSALMSNKIDISRNSVLSSKTSSFKNKSKIKEKTSKIYGTELINIHNLNKLKLEIFSLIKNNGYKISLLMQKYKLNLIQCKIIFNGIFEFLFLKALKSNQNSFDSLIIEKLNAGKFIELYLDPILNINFPKIKKININEIIIFSVGIMKKISILISRNIDSIKILSLQNNKINDIFANILFKSLKNSKNISLLNLAYNQISDVGIKYIGSFLKNNESLNTLVLSYNYLGAKGSNLLIDLLKTKSNYTLRTLDLSYNGIGKEGIESLVDFIKINGKLISLFFSGNYLCDKGFSLFSKLLFNNQEDKRVKISYLDMNNNSFTKNSYKYINNIIYFSSFITSINISFNNLGNEGIFNIFKFLNTKNKLISLDISKTNINEKIIEFISEKLDKSIALRILNFSFNNLSKACKYIKNLLLKETNLKIIKLESCNIYLNSNLIFQGLSNNNSLQTFDISNNLINVDDFLINDLYEFFKNNNKLNNLFMNNMNIDDIGMSHICQFLEENQGLKIISLKNNKISNQSVFSLIDSLQKNENIKKIELEGNQIDPYMIKQINLLFKEK